MHNECEVFNDDPTSDFLAEAGSLLVKSGQCLKDLGYEFLLASEIADNYHDVVSDIFDIIAIGWDYETAKRECVSQ